MQYKKQNVNHVKRAIILAAGFGSRLKPITLTTAKPLIKINNRPMIETSIECLLAVGITDITIVVGYKAEQFEYLINKYNVKLIYNKHYATGSLSSIYKVLDLIDNCYILDADLYFNTNIFSGTETRSYFCGIKQHECDDWCVKTDIHDKILEYTFGGNDVYQVFGISYWNSNDAKLLRHNLSIIRKQNDQLPFWDLAAFYDKGKKIDLIVKTLSCNDVIECDTLQDLQAVDNSYYHI